MAESETRIPNPLETAMKDATDLCGCPATIPCEYDDRAICLNVTVGMAVRANGENLSDYGEAHEGTLAYAARRPRSFANVGNTYTLFSGVRIGGEFVQYYEGGMDLDSLNLAMLAGMLPFSLFGGPLD